MTISFEHIFENCQTIQDVLDLYPKGHEQKESFK